MPLMCTGVHFKYEPWPHFYSKHRLYQFEMVMVSHFFMVGKPAVGNIQCHRTSLNVTGGFHHRSKLIVLIGMWKFMLTIHNTLFIKSKSGRVNLVQINIKILFIIINTMWLKSPILCVCVCVCIYIYIYISEEAYLRHIVCKAALEQYIFWVFKCNIYLSAVQIN